MDARDVVLLFVRDVVRLTAAVSAATAGDTGGNDLWALVKAVNQGRVPRERELPGGLHYFVHGIGCRITVSDQTEVDVDLGREPPALVFDAWRVWWFAKSIGETSVTERDLSVALAELAGEGVVVPSAAMFSSAPRSATDPGSPSAVRGLWYETARVS